MLRHAGHAVIHVGRMLHLGGHILMSLVVLLCLLTAGGAWRLSRGPVEIGFLKDRIETAVNGGIGPMRISFDGASVAWAGFSRGLDQPFELRVTGLTIAEDGGTVLARIPEARAALSARWLLVGRVVPRAITLEGARLGLTRDESGTISLHFGDTEGTEASPLTGVFTALGAPSRNDRNARGGRFSQLQSVAIRDARLRLDDRSLGIAWVAERADVDLQRESRGGIAGDALLVLTLSGERARLTGHFSLAPGGRDAHVTLSLSDVTPHALSRAAPALAPLAALDMPLRLDAEADLTRGPVEGLTGAKARLTFRAGAGAVHTAHGMIPLRRAEVVLSGTPERATLERAVVEVQPNAEAPVTTMRANGTLTHAADRLGASLHLTVDHAAFRDLDALWPVDVAVNARDWLSNNIQTGTVHDGVADIVLDSPDAAPDPNLVSLTATLEGDGVAATWMTGVPRLEQARVHLSVTDPDKIELDVRDARQLVDGADPIAVPDGHVTVGGLLTTKQYAEIRCDTRGTIASDLALLKEPVLRLFDRHPIELTAPAGDARIAVRATVPLERDVLMDNVTIHAGGSLGHVHLSGIVAGRDLDDGNFSLDADTAHAAIKGTGRLAGIAAAIDGFMDFRAGPPTQVLQRFTVSGRVGAPGLAQAGLDVGDVLGGELVLNMTLNEQRNGTGELRAEADLTPASLTVSPLAWRKDPGAAAKLSGRLTLSNDRITGIDRLVLAGADIQVRGAVTAIDGRPASIRLDQVTLGRTNLRGTIELPRGGAQGGAIEAELSGPDLDLSAKLLAKRPPPDKSAAPAKGPPWSLHGSFDRVLLAHGEQAADVTVTLRDDGAVTRALAIAGKAAGKSFSVRIDPDHGPNAGTRRLTVEARDAGGLFKGLGLTEEVTGGELKVDGVFDDATPSHALSGTLTMSEFRVRHAPVLGKLLQALTLYGLVDALTGEGLRFSLLTAPFEYDNDVLTLHEARAFSASLGLTAEGKIDLAAETLDLDGTVVPAYVFNSMLGWLPLVGRLFTAEKGGGLIAMRYSLQGPIDDPTVSANPLSALTPGFLRGLFGLFDHQQPSTAPPAGGGVP